MELSPEYLKMKAAAETVKPTRGKLIRKPGPRTVKSVTIEGTFPDLKTGRMYQTGHGRGSNFKVAAANAMRDFLKQPGLRAQRYSVCKATISFGIIKLEDKNV